MKRIQHHNSAAFTLIELLTVVAIVSMLVAIMSVGMRKATKVARNLRQKAELRAMETGLELFSKDFDDYPDSAIVDKGQGAICGAQLLAEALLGRDGRGFEPQTGWYAPNDLLSKSNAPANLYDAADSKSLNRRKGPYVEFKESGFYTIADIWGTNVGSSSIWTSASAPQPRNVAPVITDTFKTLSITYQGASVKVGLPILYFKCDQAKRFRVDQTRKMVTAFNPSEYSQWSYNFDDNYPLIALPSLPDSAVADRDFIDPQDAAKTQARVFYEKITQTEDQSRDFFKPFNSSTYILMSAGWDGIYGTKDDITNFNY